MRAGRHILFGTAALALLAACAPRPMTLDRAERTCREEARLADGVAGTVGIGVGTGGPRAKAGITLTNRVFNPQSEEDFVADCVDRLMSGQGKPTTVGVTVGGSF